MLLSLVTGTSIGGRGFLGFFFFLPTAALIG